MLSRFRPSPAMLVAIVALIVALSGTTYAAIRIGTKQIKGKAVTQSKLAPSVGTIRGWVRFGSDGVIYSRSSAKSVKSVAVGNYTPQSTSYCIELGFEPKTGMVTNTTSGTYKAEVLVPVGGFASLLGCPSGIEGAVTISGDTEDGTKNTLLSTTVWFR